MIIQGFLGEKETRHSLQGCYLSNSIMLPAGTSSGATARDIRYRFRVVIAPHTDAAHCVNNALIGKNVRGGDKVLDECASPSSAEVGIGFGVPIAQLSNVMLLQRRQEELIGEL